MGHRTLEMICPSFLILELETAFEWLEEGYSMHGSRTGLRIKVPSSQSFSTSQCFCCFGISCQKVWWEETEIVDAFLFHEEVVKYSGVI